MNVHYNHTLKTCYLGKKSVSLHKSPLEKWHESPKSPLKKWRESTKSPLEKWHKCKYTTSKQLIIMLKRKIEEELIAWKNDSNRTYMPIKVQYSRILWLTSSPRWNADCIISVKTRDWKSILSQDIKENVYLWKWRLKTETSKAQRLYSPTPRNTTSTMPLNLVTSTLATADNSLRYLYIWHSCYDNYKT